MKVELCDGLEKLARVRSRIAHHWEVSSFARRLEFIGDCAFMNCKSLTCIEIPSSVRGIDSNAFRGCNQLMTVKFYNEVKIGKSVFQYCLSLRNTVIHPEDQVQYSFVGCHDLMWLFGSEQMIQDSLKHWFVRLPLHHLCYCQSHHPTEAVLGQLTNITIGSMTDISVHHRSTYLHLTKLRIA